MKTSHDNEWWPRAESNCRHLDFQKQGCASEVVHVRLKSRGSGSGLSENLRVRPSYRLSFGCPDGGPSERIGNSKPLFTSGKKHDVK